jgi:hypothetical protein
MLIFFITFSMLLTSSLKISAQSFDDGPDPPPAPIDNYIYPMMLIACMAMVYFLTRKYINQKKTLNQK